MSREVERLQPVLASGDGKENEFGTSFVEVLFEVLRHDTYKTWDVTVASFDWEYPNAANVRSPTSAKVKNLVDASPRGNFLNLFDHYSKLVYHKAWKPLRGGGQ